MAFLAEALQGHAKSWSGVEKEVLAIVQSRSRVRYITALCKAHIYTDYSNMTFTFDSFGNNPRINLDMANELVQ